MNDVIYEKMASAIRLNGYCILEDALPENVLRLLQEKIHCTPEFEFTPAGIGRKLDKVRDTAVRRDEIVWIFNESDAGRAWLSWAEELQRYLNRQLLLGLFSFESHFAHYPVGGFYLKHLDAFVGERNRRLSVVVYLNEGWAPNDGGELIIYAQDGEQVIAKVLPEAGTMVMFLSEEFPHEVLPAKRERYSVAGWFRVNTSIGGNIDPPL